MKELFQIWTEGFAATGQADKAHYWGHAEGETFHAACDAYAGANPRFAKFYDSKSMTVWGCRLYDNEIDARRSFG